MLYTDVIIVSKKKILVKIFRANCIILPFKAQQFMLKDIPWAHLVNYLFTNIIVVKCIIKANKLGSTE